MTQSADLITSRLCSITTIGVALVDELAEHLEQPPDVLEVQARRRLIEDVERAARARAAPARARASRAAPRHPTASSPTARA